MAAFAGVTVTEAGAYRGMVAHLEEVCERAFTSGQAHGTNASTGLPQVFEGVGAPWPELHTPPRLFAPDTVTVGATESDEIKLVNYTAGVVRSIINVFAAHGVVHTVVLANIVRGVSINATIIALRAEIAQMVSDWNANAALLQNSPSVVNPNFPSLPTPFAIT